MAITTDRLRNWARWVRAFDRESSGTCGSVERRWDSKHWYHDPEQARPSPPDRTDAWDVEVACRLLPIRYHLMLKLSHVQRATDSQIAEVFRKHLKERVTSVDIQAILCMAVVLLSQAIEQPIVVRMHRAQAWIRKVLAEETLTPQDVALESVQHCPPAGLKAALLAPCAEPLASPKQTPIDQ